MFVHIPIAHLTNNELGRGSKSRWSLHLHLMGAGCSISLEIGVVMEERIVASLGWMVLNTPTRIVASALAFRAGKFTSMGRIGDGDNGLVWFPLSIDRMNAPSDEWQPGLGSRYNYQ